MADNDKPNGNHKQRVSELARDLYGQYTAMMGGRSTEQVAIQAFKCAEQFLAIEARFLNGGLETVVKDQWGDECSFPNLDRFHPANLISREMNEKTGGKNRELVNRISKVIAKQHSPDFAYSNDEGLRWTPDTTRVAKKLFRDYADKGIFSESAA
jgi:hypothetical protein